MVPEFETPPSRYNDAIKRELAHGKSRPIAAWLGPTKLSKAIFYATITNVAAYLPFLLLKGDVGRYIYSLPVTIACSLVASRLVSMTFIPLLSYYLLRPKAEPEAHKLREKGFGKWYSRAVGFAIEHRWKALAVSSILLVFGGFCASRLHQQFFPRENFYISRLVLFHAAGVAVSPFWLRTGLQIIGEQSMYQIFLVVLIATCMTSNDRLQSAIENMGPIKSIEFSGSCTRFWLGQGVSPRARSIPIDWHERKGR